MIHRRRYITPLLIALISVALTGCGSASTPAPASPEASKGFQLWPVALDHPSTPETHRHAVEELFKVMHLDEMMDSTIETMLKVQLQTKPSIAQFEGVMRKFLKKYASLDGVREPLTQLYMDRFSELELLQVAAFYRTPLGERMRTEFPKIVEQAAEIGKNQVASHRHELEGMLRDQIMQTHRQGEE